MHAFVGLYHLSRAQMTPLATQLENLFVFKKKKEKEINAYLFRSARLDSRTIDENGEFRVKYKLKNDKIIPSGRIVMADDWCRVSLIVIVFEHRHRCAMLYTLFSIRTIFLRLWSIKPADMFNRASCHCAVTRNAQITLDDSSRHLIGARIPYCIAKSLIIPIHHN